MVRGDFDDKTRLMLLEGDMAELEERFDKLDASLKRMTWAFVSMAVSASTAILLLAINLVIGTT